MDPELTERLAGHGQWLDAKAPPLPLDERLATTASAEPEPIPVLELAPAAGRPARTRRLATVAAAIVMVGALVGIALVSRSRDQGVGTPSVTTGDNQGTVPSTAVTAAPVSHPASTSAATETPSTDAGITTVTEPPMASTAPSTAPLTADRQLRDALAGFWSKAFPDITDATGPFPGPDGYSLSFVPGDAAPLVVVTPCGTSVSSRYDVVDGHLVIGEWIAEPGGPCPSATERKRISTMKARLAEGPSVLIDGDELSVGDEPGFTRAGPLRTGPYQQPATMDALSGRTFAGLGPGPAGAPAALLRFGPGLELRTACAVVSLSATLVDGQLRTTVQGRSPASDSPCDDFGVLAFVVSWPQLFLEGSTLRVVGDSLASQAEEVAADGSPLPGRPPATQTSTGN